MKPELTVKMFKYLNQGMVFMWRLGMGKLLCAWPEVMGTYMVITHRGRKSGKEYKTPVNYAEHAGDLYCITGFGAGSDWYRNIVANPQIEVWLTDGWYNGTVQATQVDETNLSIVRSVLLNSGFAARFIGINPKSISDPALLDLCSEYQLVRISRQEARTGSNGPGDLAWIWPLAIIGILSMRRRCCKK